MTWTVETLGPVVDAELAGLPADMRARFHHISRLIQEFGLERVREPHVRHLEGPLWEMRMKGKDGISRAIYVTAMGQRVVVVRVFVKKTKNPSSRNRDCSEPSAGGAEMTKVLELHRKWMKEPAYRKAHIALAPEFELARAVIRARAKAGLTQAQLARRMSTTQSVIARLESGRARPSTKTLERLATATGTTLRIKFEAMNPRQV